MTPADPRALPALGRIASLAGRTDDPRRALEEILGEFMQVFAADSGSIALLNPDTGRLEIEAARPAPADRAGLALKPGQGVTGWVALHGRPLLVPDVAADPRYRALRPGVRCEMAAPMESDGQVLGVVNLDRDRVAAFDAADLALLVRLTAEATAALQRLWRLRHLQDKARQLETLTAVGQSLVGQLDPRTLGETLVHAACRLLDGAAGVLYLFDPAARTVRAAASAGLPADALPAAELPLDACLTAAVIHTKKSVEFPRIAGPGFDDLPDLPRGAPLRSLLAAPLPGSDAVLGVLAVFTAQPHRFDNDEKRLLGALAGLGAVALDNARLYARAFASEDSLRKGERLTTLGLLAAEIAHEIRNPLTVIKLLYGHLGLDFPEPDPRRKDVRVIREKLDQLEAIVSRVLGFAQAPGGLHSRWAVSDLVEDTLVLVRLKLAQQKITAHYEPAAPAQVVEGHKGQLQQVLLNLIFNAMQAMPAGGALTLRGGAADRDGAACAVLDVTDTGGGIPAEIRGRIFDSFLTGRAGGTGLGLAIAQRIVASHHGELAVLATGPGGTTMRILLPAARPI